MSSSSDSLVITVWNRSWRKLSCGCPVLIFYIPQIYVAVKNCIFFYCYHTSLQDTM